MIGVPVPRCLLCGARHATCGPAGTGTPIDLAAIATRRDADMGELAEYEVTDANGYVTTMMLDEADAARLGAKRRTVAAKSVDDSIQHRARVVVSDKARRPSRT